MDDIRPSYYAIIPADIRYDDRIPANAKLLYGEISALIGAEGFCYASNQYFSRIYGMSADSITRLFKKLEETGYIIRELEKDNLGQVVRRKIYLSMSVPHIQPPDNFADTPLQKSRGGTCKKVGESNINNIIIPPNPPEGDGSRQKTSTRKKRVKAQADTLPERFERFWDFYRTHIPADRNAGSRQKAIRAWDSLELTDDQVTEMAAALANQVKTQSWISGIGVPHASTWLNNRGWEDDWGAAAAANNGTSGRNEEWLN